MSENHPDPDHNWAAFTARDFKYGLHCNDGDLCNLARCYLDAMKGWQMNEADRNQFVQMLSEARDERDEARVSVELEIADWLDSLAEQPKHPRLNLGEFTLQVEVIRAAGNLIRLGAWRRSKTAVEAATQETEDPNGST